MAKLISKFRTIQLIFYFVIILGCSQKETIVSENPSFKFNNINLDQVDYKGNKLFKFITNKAYITESSKMVKAIDPLIILYQSNLPYYHIKAKSASIINNGEIIQLDEKVNMKSIQNLNFELETEKITWKKNDKKVYMEGGIKSYIHGSSFSANKATYDLRNNTITFSGIKNYIYNDIQSSSSITIEAGTAVWDGNINRLRFTSPSNKVKTKIQIF